MLRFRCSHFIPSTDIPNEKADILLRINLLDLKVKYILDQFHDIYEESESESLILNSWFYFWGLIIWIFAIIMKIIIKEFTTKRILPKLSLYK